MESRTALNEEEERFEAICRELIDLRRKKNRDYGKSWKLLGLGGIVYQIAGRGFRIFNIHRNGQALNESMRDSLRDMAIYSLMAILLIDANETEPMI